MIFFKAVTTIFFSIACVTISYAQQKAPRQVCELKKQLVFLEEYSYSDYPQLDIDSVAYQAGSMLASFLKSQASIQYSIDTLLYVTKSMDDKVKIYSFSFHSGVVQEVLSFLLFNGKIPMVRWELWNYINETNTHCIM